MTAASRDPQLSGLTFIITINGNARPALDLTLGEQRVISMNEKVHDDTGTASAEGGIVFLDGPDGTALALTPEAAERTGQGLVRAAEEAKRQ